jgi:phosphoribosylformylglycinamidine synthase subunit PurL
MTASGDEAAKIVGEAKAAGVPASIIGVTGGDSIEWTGEAPIAIDRLARAHEDWLPTYMAGAST